MVTGKTAESYRVFVRNWWKRNPTWPGGLEPDPRARKTTLATRCTEEEALARCEEYARSRKAEYERES